MNKEYIDNEIHEVIDEVRGMGYLKCYYTDEKDYIYLDTIIVYKDYKRKGLGTYILSELKEIADRYKKYIVLNSSFVLGTPQDILDNFYKKNGFTENDFIDRIESIDGNFYYKYK
jgi:GNAT superfamily N-acetyltransferase